MLMVIFGAGASYDAFPDFRPRLQPDWAARMPQANDLFERREIFKEAQAQFTGFADIIPRLRFRRENEAVETVMSELLDEAKKNPRRHPQLAAIRYYLQNALWANQVVALAESRGVTNHRSLLDQIEAWRSGRQEPVWLVTFNYDEIIEHGLREAVNLTVSTPVVFEWGAGVDVVRWGHLPRDYVTSNSYKLIKLHGSLRWFRPVKKPVLQKQATSDLEMAKLVIANAQDMQLGDSIVVSPKGPLQGTRGAPVALFPAIAIPTPQKQIFECPKEHLEALTQALPEIDTFISIGWRGQEEHFLKLLWERWWGKRVRGLVIDKNGAMARTVADSIAGKFSDWTIDVAPSGFTDSIVDKTIESFLSGAS